MKTRSRGCDDRSPDQKRSCAYAYNRHGGTPSPFVTHRSPASEFPCLAGTVSFDKALRSAGRRLQVLIAVTLADLPLDCHLLLVDISSREDGMPESGLAELVEDWTLPSRLEYACITSILASEWRAADQACMVILPGPRRTDCQRGSGLAGYPKSILPRHSWQAHDVSWISRS
jgi:hypothetical protein